MRNNTRTRTQGNNEIDFNNNAGEWKIEVTSCDWLWASPLRESAKGLVASFVTGADLPFSYVKLPELGAPALSGPQKCYEWQLKVGNGRKETGNIFWGGNGM